MQGQGNILADTMQRDMSSSAFSNHVQGRSAQTRVQQPPRGAGQSPPSDSTVPDPAASLTTLLNAAPVDLCRVSEEMRAHPDLQALVMRLACYLSFSPDTVGTTIEEAVIVVGTDRLRVLVYLWSLLRQRPVADDLRGPIASKSAPAKPSRKSSRGHAASHTEMSCLANFLESLGVASGGPRKRRSPWVPPGSQEAEFFELTDMLVRDIVSFIPQIEPAFRKQHRPVSAAVNGSSGRESE
jgi:HDOD domain-containing protein